MARPAHTEFICREIVRLLKEERERQALTRYALAKRSGLSPQALVLIENGERLPSLETTLRIAIALDVSLGKLISSVSQNPPTEAES